MFIWFRLNFFISVTRRDYFGSLVHWVLSMISDEMKELGETLNKLYKSLISEENVSISKCCKTDTSLEQGVIMVKSFREFMYAIDLCRLAFVLISSLYCPYCHIFKPIFSRVAKLYNNKAVFIEVNADDIPEVAMSLNVYSTPATIVLLDKRPIDVVVGYMPFNSFNSYVSEIVHRIECRNI